MNNQHVPVLVVCLGRPENLSSGYGWARVAVVVAVAITIATAIVVTVIPGTAIAATPASTSMATPTPRISIYSIRQGQGNE